MDKGIDSNYCKREYKKPNYIKSNIAIDIGANIGGFCTAFHNVYDEIIFFEANPSTFKTTLKNTCNFSNIRGYNLAVSDKSEQVLKVMNHFNKHSGSVSCSPSVIGVSNSDWKEEICEIQTISLEDIHELIGEKQINFLKMDCENSEYEILLNKDLTFVDYIAMELHSQMGEHKWNELVNYLKQSFTLQGNTTFKTNFNEMIYCTTKSINK